MPLLSPSQIHSVLRESQQKEIPSSPTAKTAQGILKSLPALSLSDLLEKNNLTPDEILDNLSSQMRSSDQASVRLAAAKIGLQLNGLLDSEQQRQDFNVTIVINDSEFGGRNPILIPRTEGGGI